MTNTQTNEKETSLHQNHRSRMKNTFIQNGMAAFSDIQKLEFVLFFAIPQKDVNPLAHKLINEFGSINKVFEASYYDLIKVPGVGSQTALLIKTCKELMHQISSVDESEVCLNDTKLAKDFCFEKLKSRDSEVFLVVCLDDRNKVIGCRQFSDNVANKVRIDIRKITNVAFMMNASKIVIAHNHPSGSSAFSDEDVHLTHSIICSCLLNDVEMLDHVLVTPTTAVSLKEIRLMDSVVNSAITKLNISSHTSNYYRAPNVPYKVSVSVNENINTNINNIKNLLK